MKKKIVFSMLCLLCIQAATTKIHSQNTAKNKDEVYRPQVHFSPKEGWMNDPNGMIYFNKQYHLYYQYYPNSSIWGPMHWGHATSKDLINWQEQPIALFPDSLGHIFSGSAVADSNNTSGFGKDGKIPLVAIFTHHDMAGEKAGKNDIQTQSIAYSLDEGMTWTKYKNNPVVKNPGIRDFRDPKVSWFEESKKWIMTLATLDRVTFFSSPDLKSWTKESEFGNGVGSHGGVWECPDLFQINYRGQKIWVLLVSVGDGGPNGGSATQYFTGQFDGKNFTSTQKDTKWLDYGTDNYAGITWSNTGSRKIFIGWMSNWEYAKIVPTETWRSAMTIPRDLAIEKVGDEYFVTSIPVKELYSAFGKQFVAGNISPVNYDLGQKVGKLTGPAKISFNSDKIETFSITLSNEQGEKVEVGYNKDANYYYVDRSKSGKVRFNKDFFATFHYTPRLSDKPNLDFTLIIDNSSIELFADNGLSVMTEIYFPTIPYNQIRIQSQKGFLIKKLEYINLNSIRH